MPRGGAREGAGRKPGVPNKATQERTREIVESGITPLEWMLNVLRDPMADYERRDRAAVQAAPYVHAKLASTELTGKDGKDLIPEQVPDLELARRVAFLLRKATEG